MLVHLMLQHVALYTDKLFERLTKEDCFMVVPNLSGVDAMAELHALEAKDVMLNGNPTPSKNQKTSLSSSCSSSTQASVDGVSSSSDDRERHVRKECGDKDYTGDGGDAIKEITRLQRMVEVLNLEVSEVVRER